MMGLKFKLETLEGLSEEIKALYVEKDGAFVLGVEDIPPPDTSKEAEKLRIEREHRRNAETKLEKLERERKEAEEAAALKAGEYQKLYGTEKTRAEAAEKKLNELQAEIATKAKNEIATKVAAGLTRDPAKMELLKKEAIIFLASTPEGVKINGPDGDAWDETALQNYLAKQYPFLADGSQASGGGASGSNRSAGGAKKKFNEYTGAELAAINKADPAEYNRLKAEFKLSGAK